MPAPTTAATPQSCRNTTSTTTATKARFLPHHIAHKVAHCYWSGNAEWIDEGAADFLAAISENARAGAPVAATNQPCPYARSIARLEKLGNGLGSKYHTCNYSLGERLFLDLYRSVGRSRFRKSRRDLYRASLVENPNDRRQGAEAGIAHLREAFQAPGAQPRRRTQGL